MNTGHNIDNIKSRLELAEFVAGLAREAGDMSSTWENRDLASFLEALAAWIVDMDGYFTNRGESPPAQPEWKTVAQMLAAARVYE